MAKAIDKMGKRTAKRGIFTQYVTERMRGITTHGVVHLDETHKTISFVGNGIATLRPEKPRKVKDSFTVEAEIKPATLARNQVIVHSENPPVKLELRKDGRVVGGIKTNKGWEEIHSGERLISKNETVAIRLLRDSDGKTALEINDRKTNEMEMGSLDTASDDTTITIGGEKLGKVGLFSGEVTGVRFRDKAVSGFDIDTYRNREDTLKAHLAERLEYAGHLGVFVNPDTVDNRFNEIKAILAAAGVEDVSALATLRIDKPTQIVRNQIIVAPRKAIPSVTWSGIANELATASVADATILVASVLANQNSAAILKRLASDGNPGAGGPGYAKEAAKSEDTGTSAAAAKRASLVIGNSKSPTFTELEKSRAAFRADSKLAKTKIRPLMGELIQPAKGLEILKPDLIKKLESKEPSNWPPFTQPDLHLLSITTIPVGTSVIIAGVLDLTDQELRIEPDVKTLYIIAEKIIGDVNASITWRRPGGHTPARLDDPNKNGRSYQGVHTASGSRNGLPGGDGLDGEPGFVGEDGLDAPSLEVWVKNLTAMPDIDLNGEQGIKGGRGQRGGRGGNGAKGETGKWWWLLGVHCWEDPGHGGDGGEGGRGGRGGQGGTGGKGGDISIGVLEGTLASTVEARAFRIRNERGAPGDGGDGGPGGQGGNGGPHGNDWVDGELVCGTGRDGADRLQAQPGPEGHRGNEGTDGRLRFFEFTEESWNEQLTRPWLYSMTPTHAFPGDEINIVGTRFADTDRVIIDGLSLYPTIEADESLTVTLPNNVSWGEKTLLVRRHDGDESNLLRFWVKPRLDALPTELAPDMVVTITGRAFANGAQVIYNGDLTPATFVSSSELSFTVPGTGGTNVAEHDISVAVRNPDGETSNTRTATVARTLDTGFRIGTHDFAFDNFAGGSPSWSTFEDTFGALEVWHEALDPIFGHPILTAAFYGFYHYFLLGEDNGGLATGFCTSLSAIALDEFHTGSTETHTRYVLDAPTRERFTAVHGRLLSRESLIGFHDQGRRGTANVETSFRRIETSLRDGADRESALMLFFVPAGAAWDAGYFDALGDSHCIVPIKIVYPVGHDGASIEGVTMYCWDCNHPISEGLADAQNCRLVFRRTDGEIRYDYFDGVGTTPRFRSEDGVTLAVMSNGQYHLSDHDMPFSGPFGLTSFIIDFLLSPADLLVEDEAGRRTGLHGGNILAEIPDSHPAYLAKNLYMLPADTALTRRITGNATGAYTFGSLTPNGTFLSLENVGTNIGEQDSLAINADGSLIRFTPGAAKSFTLNLAREVGDQVRAVSISGGGVSPLAEMDLTVSPDLSIVRMGNRDAARNVDVRVSAYTKSSGANSTLDRNGVSLETQNDLIVTVTDWDDLTLTVRSLPFAP